MFIYLSCKEKKAINLRDSKRVGGGRKEKGRDYIVYFQQNEKSLRTSAIVMHFIHIRN